MGRICDAGATNAKRHWTVVRRPCRSTPYNLAPPDPVLALPDPRCRKSANVPRGGGKMIRRLLRKAAQVFDNRVSRRRRRRRGRQGRSAEGAQHAQFRTSVTPFRDMVSSRPFDRGCPLVIPDGAKRRSGTADDTPVVPPGQPAWAEPGDGRGPLRSLDSLRRPRGQALVSCAAAALLPAQPERAVRESREKRAHPVPALPPAFAGVRPG